MVGVCCEKFLFEIFEKSFVNLKIIKFIFFNFGFVLGRKWRLITHPKRLSQNRNFMDYYNIENFVNLNFLIKKRLMKK